VQTALQHAVKLEHATIPTYLYGLYSLDADKNADIAGILQSVVIEEMLHMTLASNVLNALGGSPVIDKPDFIPPFPGKLPGGVESSMCVHLRPFSMDQLETYLGIEEPADPLDFPVLNLAVGVEQPITIGQFYDGIMKAIAKLPASDFHGSPRNQVGPDLMPEAVVVVDNATAQQALTAIVEQGEGTATSPQEVIGDRLAHYYRFLEIKKGRRLVQTNPGEHPARWAYSGAPIVLDASGVYPLPDDPSAASYPAGSAQRKACDTFNYTYTSLLKSLHLLFGGANNRAQLDRALGLMMSLKELAKAMASGIPDPAVVTGPSFEYTPVNP
jgi:hypothetical protein